MRRCVLKHSEGNLDWKRFAGMRAETWRTFLIQESGAKQVDRLGIGSESDCFVGIGGPNWKDLWNFISSDSDAGLKVEKSGEAGVGQRGDAMVIRKKLRKLRVHVRFGSTANPRRSAESHWFPGNKNFPRFSLGVKMLNCNCELLCCVDS